MAIKKKKLKKAIKLTPEQKKAALLVAKQKRIEKKYQKDVSSIFTLAGFTSIKVESHEVVFEGRTGEVDNLFVYENIIVVCEHTYTKSPSDHLLKKKVLFDLIIESPVKFVKFLIETFPEFKLIHDNSLGYSTHQYEVKVAYFSRYIVPDEHMNLCESVYFFDYSRLRYFSSLSKIVDKTSKFELFKFFNLSYADIGSARIKTGLSQSSGMSYEGFLLPKANSNYPDGFKVLSFYIDPETLLQKSYVLRKDSWQNPDIAYQRMLEVKKIKSMRKYLADTARVYVNNLIVTLPSSTSFISLSTKKPLLENELLDKQAVQVQLPEEFNSIGLIDGQHRVYSYHEGTDIHESKIKKLRTHQNLLVTAIMYPPDISELDRTKFEAILFLEINNEQTKARSDLKQAIELIVRPFTTVAISKAIIARLAKNGPLKGLLEEHYFDEAYKIKTTSIVSYGLKPLVKFEGQDSLMSLWKNPNKAQITNQKDKELLDDYINFCVNEFNKLLIALKINLDKEQWDIESRHTNILSPTSINGFIICLRELVNSGLTGDTDYYERKLVGVKDFRFSNYKSSHWKQLGLDIFNKFFKD